MAIAEANPEFRAACLARQEANLAFLFIEVTEEKVGTSRIFVPSGKILEEEPYQTASLSFTSCNLSIAHSACRA